MSKKTTQLEVEITNLATKIKALMDDAGLMKEQLGCRKMRTQDPAVYSYFLPDISISKKVAALFKYFHLEIRKIEKEEQIIIIRKRSARRKIALKGEKNATKEQKE